MSVDDQAMINVSDDLKFNLSNNRISYIFQVSEEGILEHLFFGRKISHQHRFPAIPRREFRGCTLEFQGVENYNLDDTPQEYPWYGTSETRHPAVHIINDLGNSTSTFLYEEHRILTKKPDLSCLPLSRGANSATLQIDLLDSVTNILITLSYTVYQDHDVIARSTRFSNQSEHPVKIVNAHSSCLDLPQGDYELMHFRGSWAREFEEERMDVPQGRFTIESTRGTSSNAHNPFLALMSRGTDEQSGDVYATTLMYSGNFSISTEKNEFESVRVLAGINPFNFQWKLEPGASFNTPESLQVFSYKGLDGMSQVWHEFIREQISPEPFNDVARPTYLNSWEAAYFEVSHDKVLNLADKANELGVEMLVLDDGWFVGRNNDTTSLGDWYSDPEKFPHGVEQTAKQVKAKGLKFGLWFEPEMVNQKSKLFSKHPEWLIQVPNRKLSTGRYQNTLDLSQADVVDFIFERLDSFLSSGMIDYVKWDMNRVMTEVGSLSLPDDRQLEVPHRYMLGLYQLMDRITTKYPNVLFENCASGGNRFDLGMLRYMSQGWVSDMCDPIGRLSVINGASHLFPLSTLASYIGPVPNHQNGRITSFKLRRDVGFFASARGVSLNEEDLDSSRKEVEETIALYRETAQDMVDGRFHRIKNTNNEVCWQLTSRDKLRVYVGYYHVLSAPNLPYRRARLFDLDPKSSYRLKSSREEYAGDVLMNLGLDLPYVDAMQHQEHRDYSHHLSKGDFASKLMFFEKV